MRMQPIDRPLRPALIYFGGKWRMADWIISYFAPHDCYVEPFAGSAGVLLQKPPSTIEVLNDLDGDIVNFFRVLRTQADDLIRQIELTPYSRQEYKIALQPTGDPLERARRLYVRSWQAYGGYRGGSPSGWSYQRRNNTYRRVTHTFNQTHHLWQVASRLKLVQIECDDAINVIRRYDTPETLFYLDPPYLPNNRHARQDKIAYTHEMTIHDHEALLQAIIDVAGMVAISGYASKLYREALADWELVTMESRTKNTARKATEHLWLNPRLSGRRLPLFGEMIPPAERA